MMEIYTANLVWHPWITQALSGAAIGALSGYLFFRILYSSVQQCFAGNAGLALIAYPVRFSIITAVMLALAQWGVSALLAALIGLTLARRYYIHRLEQAA